MCLAANDLACLYYTPIEKEREGEMNIMEHSLEQRTAEISGETIQNVEKPLARRGLKRRKCRWNEKTDFLCRLAQCFG